MSLKKALLLAPAALCLAGCVNLDAPITAATGTVAQTNFDAQVVDPSPAKGAPMMDAAMADAAIARYRSGQVKTGDEAEQPMVTLNLGPTN